MGLVKKTLNKVKNWIQKSPQNSIAESYEFVEDPDYDDHWLIRLKAPPWTGITYRYTVVRLLEDKKRDKLVFKFDFDIVGVPENIRSVEFPDAMGEQFKNLIGHILGDIMMNHQDDLDKLSKK